MPQNKKKKKRNATSKLNMLTTKKGEILTLKFSVGPFLFKGTKMEKTTQDLQKKKKSFTFKSHGYLLPGGMLPPCFLFWPPPRRWWRHLHHLRRGGRYLHHLQRGFHDDGLFITTTARGNQLTHDKYFITFQNSNAICLPYLHVTNLLIIIGFSALQ